MRGFTLLEMMVVLVIAGLLFALTPPLFTGAVSGTRLKGLARDLVTMMRETRSQAIIRNAEQQMYLDTEARHYRAGDNRVLHLPEGVTMTVQPATAPDDPAQQQRCEDLRQRRQSRLLPAAGLADRACHHQRGPA